MPNSQTKESCKKDLCYVESICTRCDFFDGTDDELECGAFKILKALIVQKKISLADIKNVETKENQ